MKQTNQHSYRIHLSGLHEFNAHNVLLAHWYIMLYRASILVILISSNCSRHVAYYWQQNVYIHCYVNRMCFMFIKYVRHLRTVLIIHVGPIVLYQCLYLHHFSDSIIKSHSYFRVLLMDITCLDSIAIPLFGEWYDGIIILVSYNN